MKPMMAQAVDIDKIDKYSHYLMEPKLDGMRLLLHFPYGKLTKALTRSGRDVLPQVPRAWVDATSQAMYKFWHHTGYEWWDCEFGYGSAAVMDFNQTMRIMGSGPEEAQRKAAELHRLPTAVVFDVPDQSGPLWERRQTLAEFEKWEDRTMEHDEFYRGGFPEITIIPQHQGFDMTFFDNVVKMGGEGIMLKNPVSDYLHGKRRANTWYKLKKFDTVEMFVVGFDPGQGKYEGLIGAMVVETVDGLQLRCSGMTDAERVAITARQERIARERWVCEVKYFGLTAGTPRHPQFLRWRADKPASECFWKAP